MATLKVLPMHIHKGYTDDTGLLGTEAANQTFKVGNLVYPVAGAYTATPAGATAATAANRLAMSDGQNKATPTYRVQLVDPGRVGNLEVTAGGAASSSANIRAGLTYGYAIDATTGLGYLDLTNTTNAVFRIEDSVPTKGKIGDTNVAVIVTIVPAAR